MRHLVFSLLVVQENSTKLAMTLDIYKTLKLTFIYFQNTVYNSTGLERDRYKTNLCNS